MLDKIKEKIITKKVKKDKKGRERWRDKECRVKKEKVRKMFRVEEKKEGEREVQNGQKKISKFMQKKKRKKEKGVIREGKESENAEGSVGDD